tara:strand:- start:103 stop:1299 length:1197 start_codon:yes stop_codon:yes gene_type:complete
MNIFNKKKILLIICGGIAAYKSLELIRLLKKRGAFVKTVLTKSGSEFITPLSISSLSQEKVYTNLFEATNKSELDHISLSRWADIVLIAPATANIISKLSYGLSDDLASAIALASNKQIFIAPAMNVRMWEHQSTKENISKIKEFGYRIIGPEIGDMACGEYGKGKMTEPKHILNFLENYLNIMKKNNKFRALVTAGPTYEYIDPVRYISNRSSGKQGYEIAKSLVKSGFETTLISGPTHLNPPYGINLVKINSAEEMFNATINNLPVDVAIFSAAVGDYRVTNKKKEKIKKSKNMSLDLEKNVDIISHVSKHNSLRPRIVIGFAAETNNLIENSQKKLLQKKCDWIIANDISNKNIGFGSDFNEVVILSDDKKEKIPRIKKSLLADKIVERVISQLN